MSAHPRSFWGVLALLVTVGATQTAAQDSLTSVRGLYASASYEDALTMLARLDKAALSTSRVELERYRVLSLVALGRDNEASQVIERIVGEDPLYVPDQADTPPRVRVAFRDARRRLLPDIAKKKYASGKASFDLKEYSSAAAELERAIRIIDDPDVGEPAGLRDLRVLAAGFLDLSNATLWTIVEPVAPPALVPATASTEPATEPPPSPSIGKVVPPVPVRESMPGWQASGRGVRLRYSGALQITIDEKGDVESATILSPLHPEYNRLLLQAARSWKYQPAEKDGKPIKFVKIIPVELEP